MSKNLLASIIINNYNYEKFIGEAIDSALYQTYSNIEVIVVDDGSTDNSRQIINSMGGNIIKLFKPNGGQASAFNEGFKHCRGQVIIFLDSDDLLYSLAVQNVMEFFENDEIAKVHWPLEIINEKGAKIGKLIPKERLQEGDFREHALSSGPPFFLNPPTSGNAWSRSFLESVLPMPEEEFKIGADQYLFEMVALFGMVRLIKQPQGAYRVHNKNNYFHKTPSTKFQIGLTLYDEILKGLVIYCQKLRIPADPQVWLRKSWYHRQLTGMQELMKNIPENSCFIFVDSESWGLGDSFNGRKVHAFLEMNNAYFGLPENDEQAIRELEIMRKSGISYIAFAWQSFWWLEYYSGFQKYLRDNFKSISENEQVIVFDLK